MTARAKGWLLAIALSTALWGGLVIVGAAGAVLFGLGAIG